MSPATGFIYLCLETQGQIDFLSGTLRLVRDISINKTEPEHDKTNKMSYARSAKASAQSDQSLRCALKG